MKIKGWKRRFQPHILSRGEEYYRQNAVRGMELAGDSVSASVFGTEEYEVNIVFKDGSIEDMSCTCPYADDGSNCKHMAAVLYALENTGEAKPIKAGPSLSELIGGLSEEQAKALLQGLAERDKTIADKIRIAAGADDASVLRIMEADIGHMMQRYSDRDGYIAYEDAYGCMCELCDYVSDTIPMLVAQKRCVAAFYAIGAAFTEAVLTEMDDSDGGLSMLAGTCKEQWETVLERADLPQKRRMYSWIEDNINGALPEYAEVVLIDMMLNCFDETEFLEKSLALLRRKMENAADYLLQDYVMCSMEIMKKLNYPRETIDSFRSTYRFLPQIRENEISQAIGDHEYDRAIDLLRESIETDGDFTGLVMKYERTIIAVYEKTDRQELLREELMHYISSFRQDDLVYIKKYKDCLSPDEWREALHRLSCLPTAERIRCELFASEKMYRELFDEIRKKGYRSLLLFCRYDALLRKRFPEETLSYYADLLCKAMEAAASRAQYREIIGHFSRMKQYDGGKERVAVLAQKWRAEYPRRRAMLEELNRARV